MNVRHQSIRIFFTICVCLYSINEKAVDLPAEDVKRLLKEITKARIEGAGKLSTNLQLKINRMYQESRENLDEKLRMGRERVAEAQDLMNEERQKRGIREEELINIKCEKLKNKALFILILELIFEILFLVIGYFLLTKIYCRILTVPIHVQ